MLTKSREELENWAVSHKSEYPATCEAISDVIENLDAQAELLEMAIGYLQGMSYWDQCSPDKAAAIRDFLEWL